MGVRISIIEDDTITRESLAALVAKEPDLEFVAAYASAEEALADVARRPPDVVVIDLNLAPPGSGRMNGGDCVSRLKAGRPELRALMLTVYDDHERIFEALRSGANGYILKRSPPAEILDAIRQLHAGGAPLSMQIARQVVDSFHSPRTPAPEIASLSTREQEIVALLAEGLSSKEIATRLGISTGTVRVHLHTIYGKLGVENRTQAVVKYLAR